MYNQEEVTLVMVACGAPELMELSLKSFVKTHWNKTPLKLILVENGYDELSRRWLLFNNVPFISIEKNIGHEQALNTVFDDIKTKYCLICDTDVEFRLNYCQLYLRFLNDTCKLAGEYITKDQLNEPVKPRVGAWLFLTDIQAMKETGMTTFRTFQDWSYDVLSEYTEAVLKNGFTICHIPRTNKDIDRDVEGMDYVGAVHYGKMSWDLSKHMDREHEIKTRMDYIITQRLPLYKDVDLRGKFTL